MSDTPYTETEALLIALREGESDTLTEYLRTHLLPAERIHLARACRAINWSIHAIVNEAKEMER